VSPGRRVLAATAALYFIQGLPFGIFNDALPVYLRAHGVSLAQIGAVAALTAPWSLKVFWSPLVDRFGSTRLWIAGALATLAALHLCLADLPPAPGLALFVVLALIATASATQDIAIDAAFVRLVPAHLVGVGNGVRVTAYRAAMIAGGGITVMLARTFAWSTIFRGVALVFLALMLIALALPTSRAASARGPTFAEWRAALTSWLRRRVPPEVIGLVMTTCGIAASIAGALAGGAYVSRRGEYRGLLVLGLLQAGSNLVYAAVAAVPHAPAALVVASLVESFCGGLGTAALLSLLTRSCEPQAAATQYALLSAIFGLTRTLAGGASGVLAQSMGYAPYFALTAVLALPAFALLPSVRRWLADRPRPLE
jgi:PAT family beta-lactamase induction signal transducer AmpG